MSEKLFELKSKVENEIIQINNLFEKTFNDLTKSYLKKHDNKRGK